MNLQGRSVRIESIDVLRGLVMAIMSIDHVSYFVGKNLYVGSEFWNGPFPVHANTLGFFLRYITHLCAPAFILLMMLSLVLFVDKRLMLGWSRTECSIYYFKRGCLLLLLQFGYENFCWFFNLTTPYSFFYFGILSVLGFLMIVGGFLVHLKSSYLIFIATLAEFSTILFCYFGKNTHFSNITYILFVPGQGKNIDVYFSFIPWLPVAILGILFGRLQKNNWENFIQKLPVIGIGFILIASILRFFNLELFQLRSIPITDWKSFFYGTKYPPSLFFLMMTLGIALLILFILHKLSFSNFFKIILKPLSIIGKSALFFYVVHLALYRFLGFFPEIFNGNYSGVMFAWFVGLLILLPLTWAFLQFKKNRNEHSLWRMF